ncbi:type II toxin-antitoxin system YafQ family toxin [Agrobacterium rubi]|uniref:Type II toxin-antitoxin system YafQ family toxin n=1 Tax=Agrobacterium rubi TaxID=28099 RepID=A0AAE7R2N9_9HYPH|nr:type II toxin-antitoxin system YafQ family toxin [Agrobacterium rubi]NTE85766.1 type II toxin-antitoxin system YafQ family toxin [Agrobacterium rubi]NTF01698.1 type II toxin-antitoxin system YafQ family toxin [Agrobacterium rubi]NTF06817.1 type II toxin-antitoxin system YafQ family toxin [Agrobacterium rubi]NTF19059.1 type II toxin-antitoxin system YafQ family toxin [Agrobacterium rubi]NTF26022.1 type II toxin-antitoxin system YafQ family toxin [Agrobacterium rubi]
MPRSSDFTKQFLKDWKRLNVSGRYDMAKLKAVMLLLIANDATLPAQFRDHELAGEWRDHRECHIGGDFLLIYRLDETDNLVVFTRTGTHSELFR